MLPAVLLLLGLVLHFLDFFDLRLPHRGRLMDDDYYSDGSFDGLSFAPVRNARSVGGEESAYLGPGGVDVETWLYGREGFTTGICDSDDGTAMDHPGSGRTVSENDDYDPNDRMHNTHERLHPYVWEHLGPVEAAIRNRSRDQADDFVLQELDLCYRHDYDRRTDTPWPLCLRDFLDDLINLWYTPLEIAFFFRSLLLVGWSTLDIVQRDWQCAERVLDLRAHRSSRRWKWLPKEEWTLDDKEDIRRICRAFRKLLGPPRMLVFSHGRVATHPPADDHLPPCLRQFRQPCLLSSGWARYSTLRRIRRIKWHRGLLGRRRIPNNCPLSVTWSDPIETILGEPNLLGRTVLLHPLPLSASSAPTPASPAAPGAPAAITTCVTTSNTFDDSISAVEAHPDKGAPSATSRVLNILQNKPVLLSSIGEGVTDAGAGGRTSAIASVATIPSLSASAAPTPASPVAPGAPAAITTCVTTSNTFDDSISAVEAHPDKGAPSATSRVLNILQNKPVLLSSIGEGVTDVGAGGRTSAIASVATISSSLAHPTLIAAQPVGQTLGPSRERIAVTIQRGRSAALPGGGDVGAGGGAGAAAGARGF